MQSNIEWATIGKIVAPFGVRGEIKVFSLSDVPNRFATLETIYVGPDHTSYTVKGVRPYKGDMVILKLAGIEDATAVDALRTFDLSIPLSQLATLPPDSYYQYDIIGLHVTTTDGRELGTLVDIMVTGGNDVYIVNGPNGEQILIPAIKEVIKQIDLIRHMMYITPMRGLLDDDALIDEQDGVPEEEEA